MRGTSRAEDRRALSAAVNSAPVLTEQAAGWAGPGRQAALWTVRMVGMRFPQCPWGLSQNSAALTRAGKGGLPSRTPWQAQRPTCPPDALHMQVCLRTGPQQVLLQRGLRALASAGLQLPAQARCPDGRRSSFWWRRPLGLRGHRGPGPAARLAPARPSDPDSLASPMVTPTSTHFAGSPGGPGAPRWKHPLRTWSRVGSRCWSVGASRLPRACARP